jgi:hypothetical protein
MYQFTIEVIRDENSFDIQPDIFGLGIHYLLITKGCHSWNIQNTPEFHFTL